MGTPVTRTGGVGSTPTPANPPTTGPGTQPSTPAATATVPGMYGWKEGEVTSEMRRLGLVARITYESTPDKCYAIRQTPSGGTVLPTGSPVDIVIARPTGTCKEV
jgi:eukaryotic-like serine/threonine-protein kinase